MAPLACIGGFVPLKMYFISWWKCPSSQEKASYLENIRSASFNYETKHWGATRQVPFSDEYAQELAKGGYAINHARVRLGSGLQTYEKGKQLLKQWRHFQLKWAYVNPSTCIRAGERFCVCSQEFVSWVLLPLEIVFVNDYKRLNHMHPSSEFNPAGLVSQSNASKLKAAYYFGSGTLQGHLLAGEERFAVLWDDDDSVWYEILSFSRPAHFLSLVAHPYVRLKQKLFAHQSMQSMLKAVST